MKSKNIGKKHDLVREICEQLNIENINEKWFSAGRSVTSDAFNRILFQLAEKTGIPPKNISESEQLSWRLLHKSHEAMLQALQTINNPTLIYRLESFLFLFINSWELLLKSKILKETGSLSSIFFNEDKSISLDKALDFIFTNENDPIKQNIIAIEELRNQATHLVIPIIPTMATRLFQAGVFNYNKLLNEWFNRKIDEKLAGSMMFIISSLDPNTISIEKALLTKKITKDVALILRKWETNVISKLNEIPENFDIKNFAIPIDINVSLIKNPNKADILASFNNDPNEECLLAIKYQRPIDKYPFSFKALWNQIKRIKPNASQSKVYEIIKTNQIKYKIEYSIPNFPSKQAEDDYKKTGKIPSNTPFIYNQKTLELILSKI